MSKRFAEGRKLIEDEERSRRLSFSRIDENVDRICDLERSDRRLTVRMIGEELNLSRTTDYQILIDELGMRKICKQSNSKKRLAGTKGHQEGKVPWPLQSIENDPQFLERVVSGDESLIFEYDPEIKRRSMERHNLTSPRHKITRMSESRSNAGWLAFLIAPALSVHSLCFKARRSISIFTDGFLKNF